MQYINIHTHQQPQPNEQAIQSLYNNFEQVQQEGYYSIGLHPWYIHEQWKHDFELLREFALHPHVKAIGECGLDKVCTTDFQVQQEVFDEHIQLANAVNKPLIIHCVKAYENVLQQLIRATVPVVFHGFNKSKELAIQIIKAGYYLSFGSTLQQQHLQEVLKLIPKDKFFLETDDGAINIQTVYQTAASAFLIDEVSLSLQLRQNAAVFNL